MTKQSLKKETSAAAAVSKLEELKGILSKMKKVVVAFSGGVDSTFLLKVARDVLGENVLAVTASSETYPQSEIRDAQRLARKLKVRHSLIHTCELENPEFVNNPPERCYFCKRELFSKLKEIAEAESIPYVLDGANHEDTEDFRPGAVAAKELGIRSPLKEVKLVKSEIRALSKRLNLTTWDKPSLACLSSRFPYYSEINKKSLKQIGQAEEFLKKLGFKQVRVRHHDHIARVEIEAEEFPKIIVPGTREEIVKNFKKLGYTYVSLDLAGYRTGSMNEPLPQSVKKK